ncbi:gamma-glutamyl hydrolase-like [Diorhabda sublineata]|uniref:gamma-glutamyl hydrolase-like n=1 Tax=Diorhabda sublineata TaxID=1163346 RepID=UPI0024E0BC39|nr:gamma-glutamyl hydrolase-like [Diorhabda sublineata]
MLKSIWILSVFHLCSATNTPVIGILAQPTTEYGFDTFIAASYVKFVELAGATVIPVWTNQSTDYYERVINYTNGLLFPGGDASFVEPGGYGDTSRKLYQLAKKSNDNGNFYPIWATCLGFEVIPYAEIGQDLRVNCSVEVRGWPLEMTKDFKNSSLFENIPERIYQILTTQNVTFNFHSFCLTEEVLKTYGLLSEWHILSTNTDEKGLKYISTMENRKYPIYGVQYHPEKHGFEFAPHYNFPHTADSIAMMQYFGNFFVNEARKNNNTFPSDKIKLNSMIYNYCTKFSGLDDNYYFLMYGFYPNDYISNQLE